MSFALCVFGAAARGQQLNPVYTDDSAVARDTLARVSEFVASGNEPEAVRELQRLLEEQPDRVVAAPGSADTFVGVRARVHAVLLGSPKLLERYRGAESARAEKDLAAGAVEGVERSRLLTAAGLEAALRVAQLHLEAGRLEAARLALEQLEEHPDRKAGGASVPQGAKDSAAMMALVARYLDRPAVWERAERWAKEARLAAPARTPVDRPAVLKAPVASLGGAPGPVEPEGLPGRPLWSARVEAAPAAEPEIVSPDEEIAPSLWVLPLVVGDTLLVNDGVSVAARDRFTLQVRWSQRIATGEEGPVNRTGFRGGPSSEEPLSLAVHGRTLVAASGGSRTGMERDAEGVVHGLDVATGKPLWSRALSRLDPQLEGATVRGVPMIDGGTVVLAARKSSQGRRIATSYLLGLSLEDGALRWVRPIASAGSYPWGGRGGMRGADSCLLHEGVVYCSDVLGAVAAVEAATGRPLWVRTMPTPGGMGIGMISEMGAGWLWSSPVPDGASIVTLTPDRAEVVRLDAASGATLGRRPAGALGEPTYLLRVRDTLVAVGRDTIVFVPLAELERGTVHKAKSVGPAITGRVVVAGDKLVVPRSDGVAVIDPANPNAEPALVRLERAGNALPLESQLLVVDARQLHSYLAWGVAERLLEERMAANPADAEPAITYAELAYRAQHPERIAPAADRALAAIERGGSSEAARGARQRLFTVLRDMAEYSEGRWDGEKAPAPKEAATLEPRPSRRGPALVRRAPPELPVLDLPVLGEVIERLGRASQTPDERVSHLMVLGRLRDAEGKPALAAEAYQHVLGDTALAQASWRGQSVSVRAELEATRRVRQLALDQGIVAYAAFDAQAARELEALGASAAPDALERLARQYPAAAVSGRAWMRASELHEGAGRPNATASDLREGLAAAETAAGAGSLKDPALVGEIAGRLVVRLQKLDQLFAAAQLFARVRTQYPEVALADHGAALDGPALSAELVKKLASLQRLARIGPELRPEAQAIAGWSIMTPRSRRAGGAPEHLMMIAPAQAQVALWGLSGGAAGEGAGRVQMLWNRPYTGSPPTLLRIDPESVYLLWERGEGGDGAYLERVATVTGATRWKTEPFRALFPADALHQKRVETYRSIDTPIDGAVRLTDVLVAMDEQAVAMVERSGRAAVFEQATGKLLWRAQTALSNVHDIDVGGGTLAIGGAAAPADDPGAGAGLTPLAVALDARTGQVMHRLEDLGGQAVRWVRLAGVGEAAAGGPALLLGLESQAESFDLAKGAVSWTILGGPAARSMDAWVLGERLYLLDESRTLWMAPVASGQLTKRPLETYEHLVGSGPIYAWRVSGREPGANGPERAALTAFSTTRGVCIFDAQGTLVGIDALEGGEGEDGSLIPPVPGEGYFVTADTTPRPAAGGGAGGAGGERSQNVYSLHILDTQSAMLRASRAVSLELPPKRLALLDGKVLVTAGANTIVYSAPVRDGK